MSLPLIRPELAREEDHPDGSPLPCNDIVWPLGSLGHFDAALRESK